MSTLNKLKRFCRSIFPAGNGDGDGEDNQQKIFHNPLLEPMPCWRALPILAQSEVLRFLDPTNLNNLRRVAIYEWYLVERFGFHVVVPARNWSSWFVPPRQKLICDSMVKRLIDGMAGKLIRGLELNEMPPPAVPGETATELVQRLISFPTILSQLNLTYVDVEVIHAFLYQCGNLRSLNYQTSLYRPIPTGPISTIFLGATFSPARFPAVGEKLIQKLPAHALHLPILTSLTLKLHQASVRLGSDWANPLYILLAVTPPNLKKFQFCLDLSAFRIHHDVKVLIHSIIAEFLSKVRETLQKFEFSSTDNWDNSVNDFALDNGLHANKALPVLSQLLHRFGSPQLQNIFASLEFGASTIGRSQSEDFLQGVAGELRSLKEVTINSRVRDLEMTHWRKFLQKIPAMTSMNLCNNYPSVICSLFLPTPPRTSRITSLSTLEKLNIKRTKGMVPRFVLEQLLAAMPNLRELELEQYRTGREIFQANDNFARAIIRALGANFQRLSNQLPDVAILVEPPLGRALFERLRILKLQGVQFLVWDVRKLRSCRNLKKLHLEIPPSRRHSFFGVQSKDLLDLVASLRKLNYIKVSKVQFPQGRNNRVLYLTHIHALLEIGTLVHNCFCIE